MAADLIIAAVCGSEFPSASLGLQEMRSRFRLSREGAFIPQSRGVRIRQEVEITVMGFIGEYITESLERSCYDGAQIQDALQRHGDYVKGFFWKVWEERGKKLRAS